MLFLGNRHRVECQTTINAVCSSARKIVVSENVLQNKVMNGHWEHLCRQADREIEKILGELPTALRLRAQELPVLFEPLPSEDLQADGIAADTLGIFAGAEFVADGMEIMPPQIILFLENIADYAGNDEAAFTVEVRTTFLHELGHFLGLDEGDLIDRGLE